MSYAIGSTRPAVLPAKDLNLKALQDLRPLPISKTLPSSTGESKGSDDKTSTAALAIGGAVAVVALIALLR